MLFNSIEFAIFFPLVVAGFFLAPQRFRVSLLLAASCFFYMAFIPVLYSDFAGHNSDRLSAGIYIEKSRDARKKVLLWISIRINLYCTLHIQVSRLIYKYCCRSGRICLGGVWHGQSCKLILPIGLSFHTFQSFSYVVEVYCGKQKAERISLSMPRT